MTSQANTVTVELEKSCSLWLQCKNSPVYVKRNCGHENVLELFWKPSRMNSIGFNNGG